MAYCYQCFRPIAPGEAVCPQCSRNHAVNDQPPFALPLGTLLHAGKYLVGKVLGQGGFGITYVGFDLALEMKVAIKEYYPVHMASRSQNGGSLQWHSSAAERDTGRESFVKEARKMAKVHAIPNVVDVREVFFENDTAYIVMDFLEGENLRDRLKRTGPMTCAGCIDTLRPVMEALEKAHQRGLIHRDISPDNIMIDPTGVVWLLDLGAAKDLAADQGAGSQSSTPVIKRGFSPPEQSSSGGRIGPWTDVYAMCATVYYCLCGKLVPDAVDRLMGAQVEIPDAIPAAFAAVLRRGMELQPEKRIESMAALLEALTGALATGGRKNDVQETGGRRKTLPVAVKAGVPLALCAAILAGVFALRGAGQKDVSGETSGGISASAGELQDRTPAPETGAAASEPVPETEAPAQETKAPVQETEAPVQETVAPVQETEAPAQETETPAQVLMEAPEGWTYADFAFDGTSFLRGLVPEARGERWSQYFDGIKTDCWIKQGSESKSYAFRLQAVSAWGSLGTAEEAERSINDRMDEELSWLGSVEKSMRTLTVGGLEWTEYSGSSGSARKRDSMWCWYYSDGERYAQVFFEVLLLSDAPSSVVSELALWTDYLAASLHLENP